MSEETAKSEAKAAIPERVLHGVDSGRIPWRQQPTTLGYMKAKSITITPVLNGYIVEVGCSKVVFTSITRLADEIHAYYLDPAGVEKRYQMNAINR